MKVPGRFAAMTGLLLAAAAWEASTANGADDAFVRVSPRDPRYLELSNGEAYIPIGFNLVPGPEPEEMDRIVQLMADHGVNYCRIWLDHGPWGVEQRRSGEYDAERAGNLDRFLALCRGRGIRVKMCLEYFRDIPSQRSRWSDKPLHHESNGGLFTGMDDFLSSPRGIAQFKSKIAWYADRYGDEPAVFGWELWNEMNAVRGEWQPWTQIMLPELRRSFPRNLALQSLGSFDRDSSRDPYRRLCLLAGNDVAQVHRYLDMGAQLEVCHGDVDILSADAVAELQAFASGKPIILTEVGAVKPSHTGCSELYDSDRDGQLLHDMLYAPFFSGAAGPGHVWWWRQSIEKPNHWRHFARFAQLVSGLDPASEAFETRCARAGSLKVYLLDGRGTSLAWCRDAANTWRSELVEGRQPEVVSGATLPTDLFAGDLSHVQVRAFDPWTGTWTELKVEDGRICLSDFRRSIVVRIDRRR